MREMDHAFKRCTTYVQRIQACTTMFYEVSNKYTKNDTLINNQHITWRESRDGWTQIG